MENNERELRLGQLRLVLIVMTVVFVAILSYTIAWQCNYNEKYGFFKKCQAKVVEQVRDDEGELRDVLLYFDDDGVEYRLTADYDSNKQVGDKITIYYDENNPFGVIYSLDGKRIWLPVLTSLFGVGCGVLCVIYILSYKNVYGYFIFHKKSNDNKTDK